MLTNAHVTALASGNRPHGASIWFEAIAAGELEHTIDAAFRFTGKDPMTLEEYFNLFPDLVQPLRLAKNQGSGS